MKLGVDFRKVKEPGVRKTYSTNWAFDVVKPSLLTDLPLYVFHFLKFAFSKIEFDAKKMLAK